MAMDYEANAAVADAIAMGRNAEALAAGSIAIGMNTVVAAGATNAVALGQGSVASDADTVSIGDTDNERRLVHVASGTNATDAVNVSQLYDMGSTRSDEHTSELQSLMRTSYAVF